MEDLFENQKRCLNCCCILKGRSDKKFCNLKCKNNYHNPINRTREQIFRQDDSKLHSNHRVLREFYEYSKGEKFIPLRPMLMEGFNPRFFVGNLKSNETGEKAYIVYDYAFISDNKN